MPVTVSRSYFPPLLFAPSPVGFSSPITRPRSFPTPLLGSFVPILVWHPLLPAFLTPRSPDRSALQPSVPASISDGDSRSSAAPDPFSSFAVEIGTSRHPCRSALSGFVLADASAFRLPSSSSSPSAHSVKFFCSPLSLHPHTRNLNHETTTHLPKVVQVFEIVVPFHRALRIRVSASVPPQTLRGRLFFPSLICGFLLSRAARAGYFFPCSVV